MDARATLVLIVFLAICLGAGGVTARLTTRGVRDWYPRLRKPPGTPPAWLFGPIWTALYVLMATSAWLVWREYGSGAYAPLLIFFAQLALNVAWPGMFFGSRLWALAFAEILILWLAIGFTLLIFYCLLPLASLLLVPYLLWVTYAAYLNFGIWRLNRR